MLRAGIFAAAWLAANGAHAAPTWTVATFECSEGWEEDAATFQVLLRQEIANLGVQALKGSGPPCAEAACASEITGPAVVGSLRKYGSKVLLSARLVRPDDGAELRSAQISVGSLDELDVGAKRLAEALVRDLKTEQTVALGQVTDLEAEPDRRRKGDGGFSLGLGAMVPLDDTFAAANAGISVALGYWYETRHFAIEPTLSFRFSTDTRGDRRFFEMPLDIGAYYILGKKDFAPFFGGGVGARYMWEKRQIERSTGSVIETTSSRVSEDDRFGVGAFGRVGFLILRTYTVRISTSARYSVSFMELNGIEFPQTVMFDVAVHF